MIDPKELRIGNWVKIRGLYEVQVVDNLSKIWFSYSEWQACNLFDTEPIPLTHETLLRCGFSPVYFGNEITYYESDKMPYIIIKDDGSVDISDFGGNVPIKYLHQLQNILALKDGKDLIYSPNDKINH